MNHLYAHMYTLLLKPPPHHPHPTPTGILFLPSFRECHHKFVQQTVEHLGPEIKGLFLNGDLDLEIVRIAFIQVAIHGQKTSLEKL